jgi:choline dehydrogenase-like flavoprotein
LHALATRVLFDDSHRAVGIEYLKGEHLYRADARPDPASGEKREVRARREVILAGGAFNTPQLLMLSGIGPRATLQHHSIPVRVDRSGVGQNLQDRYEISVVNRMAFPHWRALAGARFAVDDPLFERWANSTSGMYTSNGAVLSLRLRSEPARSLPDLFLMALMSRFEGYFPGYSHLLPDSLNYLTWVVLKAHTNNCAGEVTLRSADPRDPPLVNFCYFDEGSDTAGHDLRAVVGAIRFVRKVAAPLRRLGWIAEETFPGQHLQSDDELAELVRNQAWGHHAACSCAIGPMERNGVLDSAFRVHGVQGLRVVDASAFPQLPGFFPVSAVYMIGEKAADLILADVPRPSPTGRAQRWP